MSPSLLSDAALVTLHRPAAPAGAELRTDVMLLTHGRAGTEPLIGAALLIDAVRSGHLDVLEGRRVVAGRTSADEPPLLADLRARVLAAAPAPPYHWLERTAEYAPHRIATELVVLGTKSLKIIHRMYDSETNAEVAEMELVGVYFDTERRLPVELPQNVREIAESMRVTRETPIAPWAGAHGNSRIGITIQRQCCRCWRIAAASRSNGGPNPNRRSSAAFATTRPCASPSISLRSRVSMLPRTGMASSERVRHGSSAGMTSPSNQARRGDDERIRSESGCASMAGCLIRTTSRASARGSAPAICEPAGISIGRSLNECTMTSTSPARSASRRAETKTPVPPIEASGAEDRSPSDVIVTSSYVPSCAAMADVCATASALARVPTRSGAPAFSRAVMGRPPTRRA